MDQNLIIVDHPLVQHKLTLMREKETRLHYSDSYYAK